MKIAILLITLFFLRQVAIGQSGVTGIDTTETLNIGGIQQVFRIKGRDITKPVLLYLHGAGGNSYSVISNTDKLTSRLQEYFVVVLWDQREYGKTFELNKSPKPLTIKLIVDDTKEVVDYLLKKFDRKKLYLAGHSMGSVMGIHIAQKYPELLYALIEMSPAVNGIESQKIGLSMLKKHFKKINNKRAIKELAAIQLPARDFESLFTKYIWQTEYDGEHISDTAREEIKPILKKWMETSAASLSNEVFEMNFFKQFPSLNCPVYFFVGRKDFSTNYALSEKYYKKLKCPKKELFWFEKSAHNIPDTEPDLMQDIIINKVMPDTQN
jgi:pimeloyl-ACP methyl ester carboxylesterase